MTKIHFIKGFIFIFVILVLSSCGVSKKNSNDKLPKIFGISRLTSDGQPDMTFGKEGRIEFKQVWELMYTSHQPSSEDVFLTKEGNIIARGEIEGHKGESVFMIDKNGKSVQPMFGMTENYKHLRLVAVKNDDSLLFVNFVTGGWKDDEQDQTKTFRTIHKIDFKGKEYPNFKTIRTESDEYYYREILKPAVLTADNKILFAGHKNRENQEQGALRLRKYDENGNPDKDFGEKISFGPEISVVLQVEVQADEKIVVVGQQGNVLSENSALYVFRFNRNGTPDLTFGKEGVVETGLQSNSTVKTVALLPNGEMLVGGWKNPHYLLIRYRNDGQVDPGFGDNGQIIIGETGMADGKNYIWYNRQETLLQGDGKIVTAYVKHKKPPSSSSYGSDLSDEFIIKRFQPNGMPDTTFGNQGVFSFNGYGEHIFLQPDNKLIATGRFTDERLSTESF